MTRPAVLLFDMIETVFSLEALRAALAPAGLEAADLETLFATTLRDAFALASAGGFAPFPEILGGAFDDLCAKRSVEPGPDARASVLEAMRRLEPQPDARAAFERARDAGIEVRALSNGAEGATQALLERAGLDALVAGVHSVEAARTYKPNPAVYETALREMGRPAGAVMLVATHAWDCHGAKRAGLQAGFVARRQPYPGFFEAPDVSGDDLLAVVDAAASR